MQRFVSEFSYFSYFITKNVVSAAVASWANTTTALNEIRFSAGANKQTHTHSKWRGEGSGAATTYKIVKRTILWVLHVQWLAWHQPRPTTPATSGLPQLMPELCQCHSHGQQSWVGMRILFALSNIVIYPKCTRRPQPQPEPEPEPAVQVPGGIHCGTGALHIAIKFCLAKILTRLCHIIWLRIACLSFSLSISFCCSSTLFRSAQLKVCHVCPGTLLAVLLLIFLCLPYDMWLTLIAKFLLQKTAAPSTPSTGMLAETSSKYNWLLLFLQQFHGSSYGSCHCSHAIEFPHA